LRAAGIPGSDVSTTSSASIFAVPLAAITPNSAACPRSALIAAVRCPTSNSRCFAIIVAACSSTVFTATVGMLGRDAASPIASASCRSFLFRLMKGFTYCGGISFT